MAPDVLSTEETQVLNSVVQITGEYHSAASASGGEKSSLVIKLLGIKIAGIMVVLFIQMGSAWVFRARLVRLGFVGILVFLSICT